MYLIWTIINAAFIILFFALLLTFFAKGKQVFTNKYGNAIVVILVVGIIGLLNIQDNSSKNEYLFTENNKFQKEPTTQVRTIIEKNTLFDISLMIRLWKNDKNEYVPIYSRSNTSGFISGHRWNFDFVEIEKIEANAYSYTVFGKLDWYLFGIKLYGQSKEITGTFTID